MDCLNGTLLSQLLPPVLISETLLGVLGNGLALWFFCFYLKPWKSSSVLLFNLALADFLLIVVLPFRASYYVSRMEWTFGDTFCNISLFLLAMNRTGSIVFLMVVAVDRYVRVVHPHHPINSLSIHKAACCAFGLWVVPIAMTAHLLAIPRNNATHCESFTVEDKMRESESNPMLMWHRIEFLLSFWIPLVVILYCTLQIIGRLRRGQLGQNAKTKKALWFVTVVVVVFIICFLPSNITELLAWIKKRGSEDCHELEVLDTAFYITITLTYLNSTLDPIVYYLSSPAFQKIFKKAIGLRQADYTADTVDKTQVTGSKSII